MQISTYQTLPQVTFSPWKKYFGAMLNPLGQSIFCNIFPELPSILAIAQYPIFRHSHVPSCKRSPTANANAESLPGSPARGHEDRSRGRSDVRTSTEDHPKSAPGLRICWWKGRNCGLAKKRETCSVCCYGILILQIMSEGHQRPSPSYWTLKSCHTSHETTWIPGDH